MTTIEIQAIASTTVRGNYVNYSVARATSTSYANTETYLNVGQFYYTTPAYSVWRHFLCFDTSSIPDGAIVNRAYLRMALRGKNTSNGSFYVYIRKQDWSAQYPISDSNRETAYDNCLAATTDNTFIQVTSSTALNTYYDSGDLDVSRINKTGYTYYSLISSPDVNNSPPPSNYGNIASVFAYNNASYPPLLVVEFSGIARINYVPIIG
ncbi:MAG: hypothetical protein HPY87_08890 [Fervidobacterium sp.]|uniref:hypothetical protein n=1 Tax=Fervidobacterium sp. TaxID=1871331 RepID=UPI0025C138D2|nr:hypothetical protein [Fervidobacterium sp.]NPU89976.1 hypothetical protein [Fervidobacterium sp.]